MQCLNISACGGVAARKQCINYWTMAQIGVFLDQLNGNANLYFIKKFIL